MGMGSLNGIFEPAPNWRWWKFNSIIMESQHCKPLLCPPFLFNRCEGFWARWRSLRLSFPQICPQNFSSKLFLKSFPQIFSSKLVRFQTDRGHESSNASWINAFLTLFNSAYTRVCMRIHMLIFFDFSSFWVWNRVQHFRPQKKSPFSQELQKLVQFAQLS